MKNLLVLVVVLAMVSVANAGFVLVDSLGNSSIDVATAGSITLSLKYVGADLMQYDVELDADNAGVLSSGAHVTIGNSGYIEAILYAPGTATGQQMEITGGYDTGTLFTSGVTLATFNVAYNATAKTIVSITPYLVYGADWIDVASTVEVQGFSVNVIPEPATIAVLSLGGLLLRRKK